MLQVRLATEEDYKDVARIGKQCWELHKEKLPGYFLEEYVLENKKTFEFLLSQKNRYVFIASDYRMTSPMNPIIGFAIVAVDSKLSNMVFEDICIDEIYRSNGYAWELVKTIFRHMKENIPTLKTWECTIYGFNNSCQRLAEKLRHKLISTTSIYEFPD